MGSREEGEDKIDLTSDSLGGRIVKTKQTLRTVEELGRRGWRLRILLKRGKIHCGQGLREGEGGPPEVPPPSARAGFAVRGHKVHSNCHLQPRSPLTRENAARGRPPRLPSPRPRRPPQQLRLIGTNLKLSSHRLAPSPGASTGGQRGWGAGGREKSPERH